MKQEDKELLFKDLCARLPYGVKIYLEDFPNATLVGVVNEGIILHCDKYDYTYDTPWNIEYITPYLFPLSSMTEEQYNEFFSYYHNIEMAEVKASGDYLKASYISDDAKYHWLNKYHFDYRGLIPMGLAKDATGKAIYSYENNNQKTI